MKDLTPIDDEALERRLIDSRGIAKTFAKSRAFANFGFNCRGGS